MIFWSSKDGYDHILKPRESYLKEKSCKNRPNYPIGSNGTKFEFNFYQIQPNSLRMYTLECISIGDYSLKGSCRRWGIFPNKILDRSPQLRQLSSIGSKTTFSRPDYLSDYVAYHKLYLKYSQAILSHNLVSPIQKLFVFG